MTRIPHSPDEPISREAAASDPSPPTASIRRDNRGPAEEAPHQPPPHALAAWEVGRQLNHLRFRLQQAWLLPTAEQAAATRSLWDALTLNVRDLGRTVQEGESLRDRVVQARERWEEELGSLWRVEEFLAAEAELRHEVAETSPREEICERLLRPVFVLFEELREAVEREVPQPLVAILRLGGFVDEGIHPRTIFRQMLVPVAVPSSDLCEGSPGGDGGGQPPTVQGTEVTRAASWGVPADRTGARDGGGAGEVASGNERQGESLVARYTHDIAPSPPDALWFREVEQGWANMGFPLLPPFSAGTGQCSEECRRVAVWVEQMDQTVHAHLVGPDLQSTSTAPCHENSPAPHHPLAPGEPLEDSTAPIAQGKLGDAGRLPFGLAMDQTTMTLRREGHGTIQLETNQYVKLLLYFCPEPDRRRSLPELEAKWHFFGRKQNAKPGTIYSAIKRLNDQLLDVGLQLQSSPNLGWRLTELPDGAPQTR